MSRVRGGAFEVKNVHLQTCSLASARGRAAPMEREWSLERGLVGGARPISQECEGRCWTD
jgi:hypothetical protein